LTQAEHFAVGEAEAALVGTWDLAGGDLWASPIRSCRFRPELPVPVNMTPATSASTIRCTTTAMPGVARALASPSFR
jgi:hypothetical protein